MRFLKMKNILLRNAQEDKPIIRKIKLLEYSALTMISFVFAIFLFIINFIQHSNLYLILAIFYIGIGISSIVYLVKYTKMREENVQKRHKITNIDIAV